MPQCITPFTVKNKRDQSIPVPCGKCLNCKKKLISEWSFRLMQEEKISSSAYFITLTYDNSNCPITRNGFMGLRKTDVQKFFKRLRYYDNGTATNLRYFIVGEYGGTYRRPHYHLLLFNAKLELIIGKKHANLVKKGVLSLDGTTPFSCIAWPLGHITIGLVSGASVGYTCKYMLKDWKPMHRNDDREPQFRLMSKRLGLNYLSPAMLQWHKSDLVNRLYCSVDGGKKVSMPRYYKEKMFKALFDDEIEAHRARKDVGITVRFKLLKELGDRIKKDKSYNWNKLQADIGSFEKLKKQINEREKKCL